MLTFLANIAFILLIIFIIFHLRKKQKRDRLLHHKDQSAEEREAARNVTREKAKSWRGPPGSGGGNI